MAIQSRNTREGKYAGKLSFGHYRIHVKDYCPWWIPLSEAGLEWVFNLENSTFTVAKIGL